MVTKLRRLDKRKLGMVWSSTLVLTKRKIRILFRLDKYANATAAWRCWCCSLFTKQHKFRVFFVTDIPGITSHPQNETRREGDNATFICNATGNPVPKISWNKGGAPLRNNSRVSLSADNKHLAIANVSRVDSGAYRCVAINSLGDDTSNPAYLGVLCKCNILIALSRVSYYEIRNYLRFWWHQIRYLFNIIIIIIIIIIIW